MRCPLISGVVNMVLGTVKGALFTEVSSFRGVLIRGVPLSSHECRFHSVGGQNRYSGSRAAKLQEYTGE